MSARGFAIGALAAAISVAAVGFFGLEALSARSVLRRAQADHELVRNQARRIAQLRASDTALPLEVPDKAAMATRVTAVLGECGIPAAALADLSPGSDAALEIPGSRGRAVRRRIVLNLKEVTLPRLGSFLEAWRRAEPDWTVTSIDINPTIPKQGHPGGDLPLNVTLAIESLFAEAAGAKP
jgi:hypothetical protein